MANTATAGPDLAIGDDEVYRRPNSWSQLEQPGKETLYAQAASRTGVSIAWRNADQIEEVEVRIVNFGNQTGSGRVSVDIVDAEGKVILHLTPPDGEEVIQVPAASMGGKEGKILRMKASWELNGLIDRFDLGRIQYGVMATIEPIGPDDNPGNNRKTKTWNNMTRVVPSAVNTFNYVLMNHEAEAREFDVRLETSQLPPGWKVADSNAGRGRVRLAPGEAVRGTLTLSLPDGTPANGAFSEARVSLVDPAKGTVYRQHEWFEIYDTTPPVISNYRAIMLKDHTIAIQALVADQQSGVLEATGVSTQWSVDDGKTWSVKAHNYKTGNFIRPTLFETVIGPFPAGTNVMLRFSAKDTAGNTASMIPSDAKAYLAPPGAEQLIQMAYVFPRIKANPVFEVEELQALSRSVKAAKARGVDVQKMDAKGLAALGVPESRLNELGVDPARFADIRSDVARLGLLSINFDQIQAAPLKSVKAAGESVMPVNTLTVTVQ